MNSSAVTKHYAALTAEERFRLILAAGARGDDAEQQRLVLTGQRITLTMPDHAPYGHAFSELSQLTFIELLEEAARYSDAFRHADEATERFSAEEDDADENDDEAERGDVDDGPEAGADADAGDDGGKESIEQRFLDLALAAGYMLRTKAEGWKLFCERMSVPPFALWKDFPGFDRLQRALALTEKAAFVPEGFLRWLNRVRPAGESERTEVPWTTEAVADATAKMFRQRVALWGG